MFDDVTKPIEENKESDVNEEGTKPPVEDIFQPTENSPAQASAPSQPPASFDSKVVPEAGLSEKPSVIEGLGIESEASGKRKVLWFSLIIVVIGIIGIGAYFAYNKFFNTNLPEIKFLDQTVEESDFDIKDNGSVPAADSALPVDSDNDGLFDDEEVTYGTDINLPDTDGDGLFDREEVKVYSTDPLNPDTDSDGFLDGQEVKAGYDPNGPGRLFPATPTE